MDNKPKMFINAVDKTVRLVLCNVVTPKGISYGNGYGLQ